MTLNELDEATAARSSLPPTDCRFRPDVRKMEDGDIGKRCQQFLSYCLLVAERGFGYITLGNFFNVKRQAHFDA